MFPSNRTRLRKNRRRSLARCPLHLQHLRPKRHVVGEASQQRCIRGAKCSRKVPIRLAFLRRQRSQTLWEKHRVIVCNYLIEIEHCLIRAAEDRQRCYRCPRLRSCGLRFHWHFAFNKRWQTDNAKKQCHIANIICFCICEDECSSIHAWKTCLPGGVRSKLLEGDEKFTHDLDVLEGAGEKHTTCFSPTKRVKRWKKWRS